MIRFLALNPGQRVLDAGCGRGNHVLLFAAEGCEVTAVDLSPEAVETVRQRAAESPFSLAVNARQGDIQRLPFENGTFDLAWASHVLHGQQDYLNAARELRRVVRPGGRVVLREDQSTMSFLPYDLRIGKPGLEFRIRKAFLDWFLEDRLKRGRCPYGWATVLKSAGLTDVRTKSFLHEVPQPFTVRQSAYLESTLTRALNDRRVSRQDRAVIRRLVDPTGPDYAFRRDDLHFTAITTLYVGAVSS